MATSRIWIALPLIAATGLWLAGCQTNTSSDGSGKAQVKEHGEHDHEGHDHEGHDHAHHGPHGGHVMVIGNEEYHAEWTHDGNGTITFYILDAAAKNEVPIAAETVAIDVKIGEHEPKSYELVAVDSQGDEGKTAQFRIVDKELEGALENAGAPNVSATLHVTIDGQPYHAKIEEHSHGH